MSSSLRPIIIGTLSSKPILSTRNKAKKFKNRLILSLLKCCFSFGYHKPSFFFSFPRAPPQKPVSFLSQDLPRKNPFLFFPKISPAKTRFFSFPRSPPQKPVSFLSQDL